MNIGIVGARKYQDRQSVIDLVMSIPAEATIITSSCKGVCTWVKEAVEERGMRIMAFKPDLENISDQRESLKLSVLNTLLTLLQFNGTHRPQCLYLPCH